jgi:serine protease Do
MIRKFALLLVLLLGWNAGAGLFAEEPTEFNRGIAFAQERLVKIYGASIGRTAGYGSGILVSGEGDILTVYGAYLATDAIRITLANGETHFAKLVRSDTNLQAAILKIEAKTPQFYDLNELAASESGDWILALSNAFKVAEGTEPLSVNLGVFNTRTPLDARRGAQDFPYSGEVLLFDAITSNPGAAGGAVINPEGKLLGMIGKVIEGKNTNTRLNYALPVDALKAFMHPTENKVATGETPKSSSSPGDLGIRLFALGGRKGPAFVDRVLPESPAAQAGIKTDDLIISLAGKRVQSAEDFHKAMAAVVEGQNLIVEIKRKNAVQSFTLIAVKKN